MRRMKNNKRGSGSVFLAIILSALILVEGLYLALIIDANRRMNIDRALKLQVESILTRYNDELFENYGLYGFMLGDIDDEIFKKAIEATGYEYGEDIFIYGYRTINTVQLKEAISDYYSYRAPGLIIQQFSGLIDYAFEKLENNDFFKNLERFKSVGGNKVLELLSNGAETITDLLGSDELADLVDIDDDDSSFIEDFLDIYSKTQSKKIKFDDDFSPEDMFSMKFFNNVVEVFENSSEFIGDNLFNPYLSHYCVYNFESSVKSYEIKKGTYSPDKNLHGTVYREINQVACTDAEYLATGYKDERGPFVIGYLILPMIMIGEIVNYYNDDAFMKVISVVAEILSDISMLLLDGIRIPKWVFELIIIMHFSLYAAFGDLRDIYDGKSVQLLKFDDAPKPLNQGISMNYKDFLFVMSMVSGEDKKLSRLDNLLTEKYGDFLTCITLGTNYKDDLYYAEMGYELYGF